MRFSQVFEPFYRMINNVPCVVFPVPFVPKHHWEAKEYKDEQTAKQMMWHACEAYAEGALPWQQTEAGKYAYAG